MLTVGLCFTLLQVTIPSAREVSLIVNDRLTSAPLFSNYLGSFVPRNRLLSEDGGIAFVYDGKTHRVPLMQHGGKVGGEALFFTASGPTPHSLTTSQAAHVSGVRGIGLSRVGNMRLLFAPAESQLLTATDLENGSIRLTILNMDARGDRPNMDFAVPGITKDEGAAIAARMKDGTAIWFVSHVRKGSKTMIYRCTLDGASLRKELIGKAPMSLHLLSFDPQAKIAVTDQGRRHEFWVVNTGTGLAVGVNPQTQGYPFISKGQVFFADNDRIYKLNKGNKLEVFCDYRLLATSATGDFWVVLDQADKAWRVKF